MHWIIKDRDGNPIDPEQFKKDLQNLNLFNDVCLEQDSLDLKTITAVRMYIRQDRNRNLIHLKIREAMPLFNGYDYKVETAE